MVGENAVKMMTVGGGSSSLKAKYEVLPLEGIRAAFPSSEVLFERGYVGDASGEYNGVSTGQDLSERRSPSQLIADACARAADADYVIFVGGLNKSDHQDAEGADRTSFGLPYGQDEVIEALCRVAGDRLVVVNISGNPVRMPWSGKVGAILQDWYLGSEAGNSLADVLCGRVNPSGKLPFTIPVDLSDGPIRTPEQYPGVATSKTYESFPITDETYSEGIYVGYRWFEKNDIKPLYPFGYGLSYTTFSYGEPTLSSKSISEDGKLTLKVSVSNTGDRAGAEVVQLYVRDKECSVDRPLKELKGFAKVFLEPGQTEVVSFTIDASSLSFFDAHSHRWVCESGTYSAVVASSSADEKGSVDFEVR